MTFTEEQIKHMVESFSCWKLPEDFHPTNGITYDPILSNRYQALQRREPVGINLLSATQIETMVRHMVANLPETIGSSPQQTVIPLPKQS